MPYIKAEDRTRVEKSGDIKTPGELNYALTKMCQAYLLSHQDLKYQTLNDIVGALECCKLEFYRRIVADYEEEKMEENGDVY